MVDSPTTRNRFRKQETGTNVNTWGDNLNEALDAIDQTLDGVLSITVSGDTTLTTSNYSTSDQAKNRVIVATGTLAAAANMIAPSVQHQYTFVNSGTTKAITFKTAAGAGVAVPSGRQCDVYSDGVSYFCGSANWISNYASALENPGDIVVKVTLESAIAAASGLTAPFILNSASDTTPGYLSGKLNVAVSGLLLVTQSIENPAANEKSLFSYDDRRLRRRLIFTGMV